MALTLKDVVESRTQQRLSSVRREPGETPRRETFALDRSDRRDALDAQSRASAARTDAIRAATATAKAQAASVQAAKDGAARADASKASAEPVRARGASAAEAGHAARPAGAGKAPSPKTAKPAQSDEPAIGPSESEGATADIESASGEGAAKTGAASDAKPEPESPSVTPPVTGFVTPPVPKIPAALSVEASASAADGDPDTTTSGSTAKSAGALDLGAVPAAGAATTDTAGFEAALQTAVAGAAVGDTAASSLRSEADAYAVSGGLTPSATAETKAAAAAGAAAHLQASPAAAASVPLGAVPMTIGLRALGVSNRFEIRLDPKELGRIDVSIDIDKDSGTVGARLVVDRPETLALLQRDASSLQQALAQTGLDASAGISLSLRGDPGEGQPNGGDPGADARARGTGQTDRNGLQAAPDQTAIDHVPLRFLGGLGRVDIRI